MKHVMSAEEIMDSMRQLASSPTGRDDVLRRVVALLKEQRPHYNWVGIYLLEGDTLVLHNYIGKPTEHTRIPVGHGVCGAAVADRENKIVDDVSIESNYLACSLETRAEIVVLIRKGDEIFGQIDIDSDTEKAFGPQDQALLSAVADILASRL